MGLDMKHAVSRELYAYWDELRAGRAAPERAAIDPAMIRGILADTFILETDHAAYEAGFPLRLSGARLNALFTTELKNRPMLGLMRVADRGLLRDIVTGVLDSRNPTLAGLRTAPEGYAAVDYELLLLPLRHGGKTHTRLLGALAPFETPSWLGLVRASPFTLASYRFIDAGDRLAGPSPEERRTPPPRRYGYLMVHDGGYGRQPA